MVLAIEHSRHSPKLLAITQAPGPLLQESEAMMELEEETLEKLAKVGAPGCQLLPAAWSVALHSRPALHPKPMMCVQRSI